MCPIVREAGTLSCPFATEEISNVFGAFDRDAHPPIAKRQIQSVDRRSVPQGRSYRFVAKKIEGPTRLSPAQQVDSQRSRLSIIYERKELAFGRNRDGRGFAVAERRRAGGKICEEHFLLVGHFAERHPSSSDQAMQKSVFAILAARFVFELTSHDLRDDDAVGNGR